jgi:hypothetical protein
MVCAYITCFLPAMPYSLKHFWNFFPCHLIGTLPFSVWQRYAVNVLKEKCFLLNHYVLIGFFFWNLQVAALNFGDFYNMQYIKMYNFFMVQLQVQWSIVVQIWELRHNWNMLMNLYNSVSKLLLFLLSSCYPFPGHSSINHQDPRGLCKWI